ncbi:MAG: hypothetical protein WB791_04095 [Waddliaceae bacterium]
MSNSTRWKTCWSLRLIFLLMGIFPFHVHAAMYLMSKFQQGRPGDYIVAAIDNTYIVLAVKENSGQHMAIEEITIPAARLKHVELRGWQGWKHWIEQQAPGHTAWLVYTIHSLTGEMNSLFSYTKNSWCDVSEGNNFLSKLLRLRMRQVPDSERKKVGPRPSIGTRDSRRLWVPRMVHEGRVIPGTDFDVWRGRWPNDSSELSKKTIMIYLPVDESKYPSYFPYWLEVHGVFGKAKVRIIDSGRGLQLPEQLKPLPS